MELRDYARGIRRHWLAVVAMTLLGVAVAAGWTLVQQPVYEATASGLIHAPTVPEQQLSYTGDAMARSKVSTYLEMATWQSVAEGAAQSSGLPISATDAAARIAVANPTDTAVLRFTAKGPTPEAAATLANAWIASLAHAIDVYEGNGSAGSAPLTITVASAAVPPTTPVYPQPQTALIVGGIVGLGFGNGFALVRTASDRRIRTPEDVEQHASVPVVGSIPLSDSLGRVPRGRARRSGRTRDEDFAVEEALRTLRTNLQFMDVDNPPRTLVITSPLPGDGKSTLAAKLAATIAASGQKVVLVDGDLRRSTIARNLGLPGGAGLSDVLAGRARLADVLQPAPDAEGLGVLAAGTVPPNPSEVLGSERMHALLATLAAEAMVIVDAPPLLAVTDGAVLTHQADGAIVVVTAGRTTYELLDRSLDALHKSAGRALGVVLNKVPLRGADASTYSYAYRHQYESVDEPAPGYRRSNAAPMAPTPPVPAAASAAPAPDAGIDEAGAIGDDDLARLFGAGTGAGAATDVARRSRSRRP